MDVNYTTSLFVKNEKLGLHFEVPLESLEIHCYYR